MKREPLNIERIRELVTSLPTRFDLTYEPVVDSTNRVIASLPPADIKTGRAVLADYQTAGRGRRNRAWTAPPGTGLLMSIVFPEPEFPADIVMAVSLAVSDALREEGAETEIKWPNDILIGGRKVCGILAERIVRDEHPWVVVGTGINVLAHPDLAGAGSVSQALNRDVDRTDLAVHLFASLDLWYRSLSERSHSVFDAWTRRLSTIGRQIVVTDGEREWDGTAVGVERRGGLRVLRPNGSEVVILAGDVSIRTGRHFTSP